MKSPIGILLVIALMLPVVLRFGSIHFVPPGATQSSLVVGLILASPIFGIGFLFYRFARWHRGFHRRMKEPRR